jgi:hypothetical protein
LMHHGATERIPLMATLYHESANGEQAVGRAACLPFINLNQVAPRRGLWTNPAAQLMCGYRARADSDSTSQTTGTAPRDGAKTVEPRHSDKPGQAPRAPRGKGRSCHHGKEMPQTWRRGS